MNIKKFISINFIIILVLLFLPKDGISDDSVLRFYVDFGNSKNIENSLEKLDMTTSFFAFSGYKIKGIDINSIVSLIKMFLKLNSLTFEIQKLEKDMDYNISLRLKFRNKFKVKKSIIPLINIGKLFLNIDDKKNRISFKKKVVNKTFYPEGSIKFDENSFIINWKFRKAQFIFSNFKRGDFEDFRSRFKKEPVIYFISGAYSTKFANSELESYLSGCKYMGVGANFLDDKAIMIKGIYALSKKSRSVEFTKLKNILEHKRKPVYEKIIPEDCGLFLVVSFSNLKSFKLMTKKSIIGYVLWALGIDPDKDILPGIKKNIALIMRNEEGFFDFISGDEIPAIFFMFEKEKDNDFLYNLFKERISSVTSSNDPAPFVEETSETGIMATKLLKQYLKNDIETTLINNKETFLIGHGFDLGRDIISSHKVLKSFYENPEIMKSLGDGLPFLFYINFVNMGDKIKKLVYKKYSRFSSPARNIEKIINKFKSISFGINFQKEAYELYSVWRVR